MRGSVFRRRRRLWVTGAAGSVERLSPEFVQRGTAGVQTNNATDVGFTYPTEDVRADDLFLAAVVVNDRGAAANVSNTASGWTFVSKIQNSEGCLSVFYKRAVGTESGAVTPFDWSASDGTNDVAFCQVFQYRYVDWTSGPIFGAATTASGDFTTLTPPTVTTSGENGLAICVQGYTDNMSGDPTISGATGGTWIAPRDRDSNTSADDIAVHIFQAPLAEAGTISGGATSMTGSSPQSSRSMAIGFALIGQRDDGTTTTVSSSIAASADDATENTGTTAVTINGTTIFASTSQTMGIRFTGLSALAGKTIVQANLQFTAAATEGSTNNATWVVKGEAADTAAQYAAVNANISGRSVTTASRTWTLPGWTSGVRDIKQRSPDIRAVVQEITNRAGYGGVVNLIITGTAAAARSPAAQDHATLQEATLTIRYSG